MLKILQFINKTMCYVGLHYWWNTYVGHVVDSNFQRLEPQIGDSRECAKCGKKQHYFWGGWVDYTKPYSKGMKL